MDGSAPPRPPAVPAPPPIQSPPPPAAGINLPQFGSVGGGGTPFQVTMGANEAYEQVMGRIRSSEVELEWEQPPSSARFFAYYKDFWNTAGMKIKYAGELTVQNVSPGVSSIKLGLSLNWGSTVPLLVGCVFLGIMVAFTNFMLAPYVFFIIIGLMVYQVWLFNSKFPTKLMSN